ncbi:HPr family phosphocarrier protein [Streptomyces atratus]|uniref:HPr family phosphocarrier protein n=1 Tax=Streptomyces atratus TaxID=1893 RepID=UPI0016712897|nr:HPr family phosphocarrier protein [Streptomyces atratus]WPW33290.1 HPr family phosphocarrier protein [Streptomyces atratus]
MHQRTVAVGNRSGLHARPASVFVQAATRQPVKVTIGRDGQSAVDARSLLSVLALAEAAVEELAALLARDLDATP